MSHVRTPPAHVARLLDGDTERRYVSASEFEIRQDGDDEVRVVGYATVFDTPYAMYGGPERYGWNERIAGGAFTKTLREKADVNFLINHDGLSLARTKSGTLTLAEDDQGLRVEASLDPANSAVSDLRSAMKRGDVDEMSFAFRVVRQEWNDDYTDRSITEVNLNKGDVSAVNYGANDKTSIGVRAVDLLDQLAGFDDAEVLAELRSVSGDPHKLIERARTHLERLARDLAPRPSGLRMSLNDVHAICEDDHRKFSAA